MSKYRFKTKKEFIRDGLWNDEYNCPNKWTSDGEMNKYLGKDVPDELNVYCNKKEEFEYDGWLFQNTDYILKEQQKYFPDLSQHIGRYIRALIDNPHSGSGVKKGDVGKIINEEQAAFPNNKGYFCTEALREDYLGIGYELLPEDYSPEQEVKEPSIEFIPGKWYKVELYNKFNHYIKVDSVTEDEIILDCEGYVTDLNKWDKGASINLEVVTKYELLTNLSEIQEYLPDGHPDKVKNFKPEVGKWYSFNWDYSGKDRIVIAKIKKVEEDYFAVSWRSYLWLDKSYSDSDAYRFKDVSNIKELSIKEIQPYLPIGHPDKIMSSEFKKGEYIVLISDGQSTNDTTLVQSNQFIKNYCYKVRENNIFLRPELDSCGSTTNGWKCILYNPNKFHKTRNWRYATQEEIDEYEKRGKPYDVTELQKKVLSMEEIQEECKRRFPIGCTFIAVGSCMPRILEEDSCTYKIVNKQIWAHSGAGYLYENGKWAELVSLPKQNDLKEEAIKYSEETNVTILLASNIKSKELHSTYGNTSLSVKLLSNKTTHLINNVREISSVNLKIK